MPRKLLLLAVLIFAAGSLAGYFVATVATPRPAAPAVGVVRYMDGLKQHDGRLIWASFSPAFQEQRQNAGDNETSTIALYDRFRQDGAVVDEITYAGGHQGPEAGYFLYVTRHYRTNQPPLEVVWIFQTNADGLIDRIVI